MGEFFQQGPSLKNQYTSDVWIQSYLRWRCPPDVVQSIEPDLKQFGEQVAGPVAELAKQAEQQLPIHIPYNPWGERVDTIETSPAWQELHAVAAREGLIAIGYERNQKQYSRLYQLTKLYLFHPSSAFYSCPLAMADGAARALEIYGNSAQKERAFAHLISRNPSQFWTSGQWMTERTGGSDVSGTSTVARLEGQSYRLYGTKWFSSATTSEMALTLARIEGDEAGSRGLSLFYLETHNSSGRLNHMQVNRLKDKLGTKALPTAELTLDGTHAELVGGLGEGVKKIATMLNITRLYNAVCSVAQMRRGLALATNYAYKREVFGRKLIDQPLHIETLAAMNVEFVAHLALTLHLAELLGREEAGVASERDTWVLRMLTPIAKLMTAKAAVRVSSEVLESFGGAGYVEDTGLPVLLRDAQVFPIWEGATNVLSLDVLRVMQKPEALPALLAEIQEMVSGVQLKQLQASQKSVTHEVSRLTQYVHDVPKQDLEAWQAGARQLAMSLGRLHMAALLLQWAQAEHHGGGKAPISDVAIRYCSQRLVDCTPTPEEHRKQSSRLIPKE